MTPRNATAHRLLRSRFAFMVAPGLKLDELPVVEIDPLLLKMALRENVLHVIAITIIENHFIRLKEIVEDVTVWDIPPVSSACRSSGPLPATMDARTARDATSGGQGARGSFSRRSGTADFP
jgi:hypothetical protein